MAGSELLRVLDPLSDEAAQAYLRSEVLELSLSTNVIFAQRIDVGRGIDS